MKRYLLTAFCLLQIFRVAAQQKEELRPEMIFRRSASSAKPPALGAIIPPDYYTRQLGFFCKQELKIQQATHVPISFRLGSVEYCDRMEAKRPSAPPPAP